jgi:hypothetical protein
VSYFSLLSRHLRRLIQYVPIHSGDFLGGGKGMRELSFVTHQVKDLSDIVVFYKVMG